MAKKKKAAPKAKRRAAPALPSGLDAATLEPAAYWVPVQIVKRWDRNPRLNKAAIKPVADSIVEVGGGDLEKGFGAPLLARVENGELIAGDTRIQAAASLGMKRVPVRFMNLSVQQARNLALADNKLGEIADWDEAKLADIMREAREAGEDLRATGFSEEEIDKIIGDALEMGGATRTPGGDGRTEIFEFRDIRIVISVPTADSFAVALKRYADARGTYNGFVEHAIACLNRNT